MANRFLNIEPVRLRQVNVATNQTTAQLLKGISEALNKGAEISMKQWAQNEVKKAKRIGEVDAAFGTDKVVQQEESTLAGSAYMEGARKKLLADLEVKNKYSLNKFAFENQNNPSGFQAAITGYAQGVESQFNSNPATKGIANEKINEFLLDAQTKLYDISKEYAKVEKSNIKASIETQENTILNDSNRNAIYLFKGDEKQKNDTSLRLSMNLKKMETIWREAKDRFGNNIYNAEELLENKTNFIKTFTARGFNNYLNEKTVEKDKTGNEINPFTLFEYEKIKSGLLEIKIGKDTFNVEQIIGSDYYKTNILDKADAKMRSQEKERIRIRNEEEKQKEEEKKVTGLAVWQKIISKKPGEKDPFSQDQILKMAGNGDIDLENAKATIKFMNEDDTAVDWDLVKQIKEEINVYGQDVYDKIKQNSHKLRGQTVQLIEDNDNAIKLRANKADNNNINTIKREAGASVGGIEALFNKRLGVVNVANETLAADMVERYTHLRTVEKIAPTEALADAREYLKVLQAKKDKDIERTVLLYPVIENGAVNYEKTLLETLDKDLEDSILSIQIEKIFKIQESLVKKPKETQETDFMKSVEKEIGK